MAASSESGHTPLILQRNARGARISQAFEGGIKVDDTLKRLIEAEKRAEQIVLEAKKELRRMAEEHDQEAVDAALQRLLEIG